jgi:cellulose synthase/poly-beta-1,6-N-acetylglucosamine synthase-like glycosyltransferase
MQLLVALIILWTLLLVLLSAYIVFFSCVGFLFSKSRRPDNASDVPAIRFLILVPAHNEADHLRPTIHSLRRLHYPRHLFDIVVIADNCTDNTALIARQEGCEAWERSDICSSGKGYALEWAFARSALESYGAVVILDADTRCSQNLLQVFAREMSFEAVAVQARVNYEFPSDSPAWLSLTSSATQRAEELYVSTPRSYWGLYQGFQGTGFCLPVSLLQLVPWSAFSICEDLEYGFQLAGEGVAIRFARDTFVTASMTGRLKYAGQQRERWARGTYGLIAKLIPRQILRFLVKRDWKSLESCLYLATRSRLPLAFLTLICGVSLLLCGRHATLLVWILFVLALALESTYVFAIVSALRPQSSRTRLLLSFLRYSIWISWRHFKAAFSLQNTRWIRTERG